MWFEIFIAVLGSVGGTAGIVGLYKAKSEKTSIDVKNMQTMLDEAHKMYEGARKREEEIEKDFELRFAKMEKRISSAEDEIFSLKSAVFQGYRCKYPQNIEDCPVLKEYETKCCDDCVKNRQCTE